MALLLVYQAKLTIMTFEEVSINVDMVTPTLSSDSPRELRNDPKRSQMDEWKDHSNIEFPTKCRMSPSCESPRELRNDPKRSRMDEWKHHVNIEYPTSRELVKTPPKVCTLAAISELLYETDPQSYHTDAPRGS